MEQEKQGRIPESHQLKEDTVKLCITSTGQEMGAKVDARFGRAPYFLIIDTDTGSVEVVENSAAAQGQGAGIGAATQMLDKDVDGILTGRVGPNALRVFQTSGVKIFEDASSEDTVQEALARFNRGEYRDTPAQADIPPGGTGGGRGLGRGRGGGRGQGQGRGMGGGRRRQ